MGQKYCMHTHFTLPNIRWSFTGFLREDKTEVLECASFFSGSHTFRSGHQERYWISLSRFLLSEPTLEPVVLDMLHDSATFCLATFPGARDGLVNRNKITHNGIQLIPRHSYNYNDRLISQVSYSEPLFSEEVNTVRKSMTNLLSWSVNLYRIA